MTSALVLRDGVRARLHLLGQRESTAPVHCAACGHPMTRIVPGQTTHPTCDDVRIGASAPQHASTDVDPVSFTARDWQVWHEAFCRGYLEGAEVERAETFAIVDDAARASVRRTAKSPDHATLWERRGNPARAAAVRDDWHRRDELVAAAGGWGAA